ncbi:MAG: bifunctional pyr operon transcriptional regulator/uracil phosphoribosyltransferase PyrR [Bacteroidetes bacterium]|nr:bifunctional pyr operon transcriptional regulator/uracil phosphoribosyltransferase PyrR [Bacteroidota bacterium]HET6244253.1 bifunctional pyr operon transcriptional regulator/uracil phosphoribosyltransferase PyrR [Bacteroidia bacterium]
MEPVVIINSKSFELTIKRLCYQLIENHNDFSNTVIVGLQPRGIYLSLRIHKELKKILNIKDIKCGNLDVTFFRDDFRRRDEVLIPNSTQMDFIIEEKKVILVDDVLFTGRTIRSGLDALLAFGRPEKVELLVLIDRRFSRDLPIQPNYIGKTVDTISTEKVKVEWRELEGEDKVLLYTPNTDKI